MHKILFIEPDSLVAESVADHIYYHLCVNCLIVNSIADARKILNKIK